MFKRLHLILVIWALAVSSVQAQTYIRDYTYEASEADSKITSRINALDQVKIILLQEIGTHIRQKINITKDGAGNTYASDDVEAITAGLTKVEIIEEKWNGETYYLKAQIDADTDRVLNALEEFKNERSQESEQQLAALKENQRQLNEARDEVKKLKTQLKQASNQTQKEKIVIKYKNQIDQISLSEIFSKAYDYYQHGQYEDAVYWYRKAAEQGHADAQTSLGILHEEGRGVKQDYAKAANWYRKPAEQGHADAQTSLGILYYNGQGVKQDYAQAANWYRKAAKQGYAAAQGQLGNLYYDGLGVNQDYIQAINWYRKAAKQGDAIGQFNLGVMYHNGKGLAIDKKKAKNWFRKSCDNGMKQGCSLI